MSVFQTARPDNAEMRYQKALETAIARKNNRRQITENHIIEKQQAETQAMLESFDQDTNNENPYTSRRQAQRAAYETSRALMSLNQRLVTEGYQKCFNVAISDIVYEGFWADDNVKQKTVQDIKATCESVLSTLSELGIQPVSEMKENQFVKNLKEVVMEACKKTADRITKEAQDNKDCCSKDDIDSISFDMTDSEINDLDDNLSELSPEDIASLVKNKVLQVIQDERECGKRKSEAFKDIDDSVKKMEEEDDDMDDVAQEAMSGENIRSYWIESAKNLYSMSKSQSIVTVSRLKTSRTITPDDGLVLLVAAKDTKMSKKEYDKLMLKMDDKKDAYYLTLNFNGLTDPEAEKMLKRKKCVCAASDGSGNILVYSLVDGNFYDFDHETCSADNIHGWLNSGISYDNMILQDNITESVSFESALIAAKKRKINRHLGDSVFECIMMGSTKDVQEHVQYAAMESVDTMSIMDAAFMETVLKYTVLETVQTMGLYNFEHSDIKKICNHYMK